MSLQKASHTFCIQHRLVCEYYYDVATGVRTPFQLICALALLHQPVA